MAKPEDQRESEQTIVDLRRHLFATLEDLRDKENPMDVERAKAIKSVASEIIESAKVDLKYIELTGYGNDTFIGTARQIEDKRGRNGK